MINSTVMRTSVRFAALAALSLGAILSVSCSKESPFNHSSEHGSFISNERTPLTVGIGTRATKSTSISADDEVQVNTLQVLVFRGDELDAYGKVSDASSITLSCTAGERVVYALVNVPDMDGISSKAALLSTVSQLSDNSVNSFQMIGSDEVSLPSASTVTIDVDRMASRVSVKKITRNFSSAALSALTFTVDAIYTINVAGDISLGGALGSSYSPSVWYNKMSYTNSLSEFTHDSVAQNIAQGASYSTVHNFYCYPNPSDADASAGTWSARHTRLVIETTLGGRKYYYPITLPLMLPNRSYEISEVTITRPGSDDPDSPVSFSDCTFEINIKDWTTVAVTEGTSI